MKLGHVIQSQQFTREWLEREFFSQVKKMEEIVAIGGSNTLIGKRMVSFFYEASTRTRASFEIAMDMLGGRVVFSTENARQFSSVAKGETLEDTIRVLCGYRPDVIVLRYDEEGGTERAAAVSSTPIINAGDGTGQHPTQALTDVYTIQKELGKIDRMSIAMVGDLARGRTVRSLSYLLAKFSGVKIYFIAPKGLETKEDIKQYLQKHNVCFAEETDLRKVAPHVDAIYQTRAQTERGTPQGTYQSGEGFFIVNRQILDLMKPNAIVMHPLPRVGEITPEVDKDPRAAYFRQSDNKLTVAMGLLEMIIV